MAKRRQYLFVCTNRRPDGSPRGSCAARGSEGIFQAIRHGLLERGLAKTEARVCQSSCLDLCDEGPIVLVEPEQLLDPSFRGVQALLRLAREFHPTLEQIERVLQRQITLLQSFHDGSQLTHQHLEALDLWLRGLGGRWCLFRTPDASA